MCKLYWKLLLNCILSTNNNLIRTLLINLIREVFKNNVILHKIQLLEFEHRLNN